MGPIGPLGPMAAPIQPGLTVFPPPRILPRVPHPHPCGTEADPDASPARPNPPADRLHDRRRPALRPRPRRPAPPPRLPPRGRGGAARLPPPAVPPVPREGLRQPPRRRILRLARRVRPPARR